MIVSVRNEKIKEIKLLVRQKKERDALGLYVVEGLKMVKEAFLSGQSVVRVVCTGDFAALDFLVGTSAEIIVVSDEVFVAVSDEVTPQGILAVLKKPVCAQTTVESTGNSLFLDGISDPGNMGAIIRTAAASGYKTLYAADCADAYSPKAVRASMSGIYFVDIICGARAELLKKVQSPIVCADMRGENVFETAVHGNFCLAIGNEANGISKEVFNVAVKTVSIPMENTVESLNAAVSAGILMYLLDKNSV